VAVFVIAAADHGPYRWKGVGAAAAAAVLRAVLEMPFLTLLATVPGLKRRLYLNCYVAPFVATLLVHSFIRSLLPQIMDLISGKEWGLLLLDEVHVVPARMFRQASGPRAYHFNCCLTSQTLSNKQTTDKLR
jgi:hypothetical protein